MLVTLTLYIIRELGKALGLSLLIFSFLMLSFTAVRVISDGIRVWTMITVLPQLFPLISPLVLPLTIITGTLICYGRLASTNEYTAVQAGGIHPFWVAGPALIVAALASLVTIFLNADVLTWSTNNIQRAIIRDRTAIADHQLQQQGSTSFGNISLCRLQLPDGHNAIDATRFAPAQPKRENKGLWDPKYPYPKRRILAADHTIGLYEDKKTHEVFIVLDNQINGMVYDLDQDSDKDQYVIHYGQGRLQLPITLNKNISISTSRISYWGIRLILVRLRSLREEISYVDSAILSQDELKDWAGFCARLNEKSESDPGSPAARLMATMRLIIPSVPERISLVPYDKEPDEALKQDMVKCLNALLRLRDFYQEGDFPASRYPNLIFTKEMKTLNARKLKMELADKERREKQFKSRLKVWDPVVIRLNRLALSAFFPKTFPPPILRDTTASIRHAKKITRQPEAAIFKNPTKQNARSYGKLTAELHLKLALSFSCLVFGFIGVPLGLQARRQSTTVGFAIGMVVCLLYFIFIKNFQGMVRQGDFPYWTMWLPNAVLLVGGIYLWFRCIRAD